MPSIIVDTRFPLPRLGRFQHGIGHVVGRQTIAECRRGLFASAQRLQKIRELVNEGVLVADLQTRHPPVFHVGMIAIRDVHAAPAARLPFIAVIEILNAMQVVQVPKGRRVLAVDFERIESLVPARIACRFKRRERAIFKAAQKRAGIVNSDRLDVARQIVFALFDKGLGHRHHFADRAIQPQRRVNVVRQQIASHAAARNRHIQSPQAFATLRQILRDCPILQELRAVMEDPPEAPFVNQLLEQDDAGTRR